jgi:hypothetical protein
MTPIQVSRSEIFCLTCAGYDDQAICHTGLKFCTECQHSGKEPISISGQLRERCPRHPSKFLFHAKMRVRLTH